MLATALKASNTVEGQQEGATTIGEVREKFAGVVMVRTESGGIRTIDVLVGGPLIVDDHSVCRKVIPKVQ
jgi:hypothetical protein